MRFGGIVFALVVLAACSPAPAASPTTPPSSSSATATTTTTSAAPDIAAVQRRVTAGRVPDDLIGRLGFRFDTDKMEMGKYTTVACPEDLATDGAMSTIRDYYRWTGPAENSVLVQRVFWYKRAAAAAETVELAKQSLNCGTFTIGDSSFTVDGELALPPLGGDAQFAVCYEVGRMIDCELVLSKGDLLTTVAYSGPSRDTAAAHLEEVGRTVAGLLKP
ncbi:hypothetical protein [Actinosynnema sp. NPDC023587]|uniref:hypothetical protein n=1 Tax=Actinosynnema sp. NPDC023587 TaxID=3154695 RepID=UPI0033E2CE36